jgi:all-trans-8'-apo-beta-carotenal 15,15'-oxygenase
VSSAANLDPTSAPAQRGPANWAGLWDDVPEFDAELTEMQGRLPEGLVGTQYRNGPGKRSFAESYFDGDGMIRALRFDGRGGASLKTRFIRTPKYVAELGAKRQLHRTAGTNLRGGVLGNIFRVPAHEGNTHVTPHHGELFALAEGGMPYQIDPESLATLGLSDLGGVLGRMQPYSPHPHIDAATGETFNFGTRLGSPKPALRTFRTDASGRTTALGNVDLPFLSFIHDFGLSSRYMIFYVPAITANLKRTLFGIGTFFDSMSWRPDLGARIILAPRDGGQALSFDAEDFLLGHFLSAWDEGDEVIFDFCRLREWNEVAASVGDFRRSDWGYFAHSLLYRCRVHVPTGVVRYERLSDTPCEFPRIHPDYEARPSRFGYMNCNSQAGEGGILRGYMKFDRETGREDRFDLGLHSVALEPIFVPRPGASEEDDGWLLGLAYDAERKRSDALIFDARCLADGPTCSMPLPISLGATFHGSFVPRS